jgi:hypothetical protein
MKKSQKLQWIFLSVLAGGASGMLVAIALPETYTLVDFQQVPGIGSDRQCSSGDLVCKSQGWRESESGQDFAYSYSTQVNDDATLQKALTFAAIGAVTFGVASLGFLAITSNKKSQSLQTLPSEKRS